MENTQKETYQIETWRILKKLSKNSKRASFDTRILYGRVGNMEASIILTFLKVSITKVHRDKDL